MNVKEIREKSDADLAAEIDSLRKSQFNLRMQRGSGQEIRPHLWRETRKTIARLKTVLRERQLTAAQSDEQQ